MSQEPISPMTALVSGSMERKQEPDFQKDRSVPRCILKEKSKNLSVVDLTEITINDVLEITNTDTHDNRTWLCLVSEVGDKGIGGYFTNTQTRKTLGGHDVMIWEDMRQVVIHARNGARLFELIHNMMGYRES